jgi:hypothetical protein
MTVGLLCCERLFWESGDLLDVLSLISHGGSAWWTDDLQLLKCNQGSFTKNFGGTGTDHRLNRPQPRGPPFGGTDPEHRRSSWGQSIDEHGVDMDTFLGDVPDVLQNADKNEILLTVPFDSKSCETCLNQGKGDFILLNLNAALQHVRSHHCGVGVIYAYKTCGKTYNTKDVTQCHVPKCSGPFTAVFKTVIYGLCRQAFRTQRGLSQHERLIHPEKRNANREMAETGKTGRGLSKGYGKVWQKDEVNTMLRLEKTLKGHPQIAKKMMEFLQIDDVYV